MEDAVGTTGSSQILTQTFLIHVQGYKKHTMENDIKQVCFLCFFLYFLNLSPKSSKKVQ